MMRPPWFHLLGMLLVIGAVVGVMRARQPAAIDPPPEIAAPSPPVPEAAPSRAPTIPDVELVDQHGRAVHLYRDLVQGHVVVINFVFTSCGTICPTMGAMFGQVEQLLGDPDRLRLISISIDPEVDTPARLAAWGAQFHAGPGWSLLTGPRPAIDALRKALAVFTPDLDSHAPVVVIGDDATGRWTRGDGLAPATQLAAQIRPLLAVDSPARRYFTDTVLVDQHGVSHRFYDDLVAGKVVVIDAFFTSCHASCPVTAARFARIQQALGDRLDTDVRLISISLDADTDTPAQLAAYAGRFGARPGWYFLTGAKPDVDRVLGRLGELVAHKEDHLDVILVGNDRTGLWKKALGRATPEELIRIVNSVIEDRG